MCIRDSSDTVVAFDEVGVFNSMPIPEGMEILGRTNGTRDVAHTVNSGDRRLTCTRWDQSTSGRVLELCLHDRGHSIPAEWVGQGLDWLASLPDGS